jgi:hypothetical protein
VHLQGIEGHGFYGNCIVPIIENTARECELTDRLRQAIIDYPQANAVLVRRHGGWVGMRGAVAAAMASRGGCIAVAHTEQHCTPQVLVVVQHSTGAGPLVHSRYMHAHTYSEALRV